LSARNNYCLARFFVSGGVQFYFWLPTPQLVHPASNAVVTQVVRPAFARTRRHAERRWSAHAWPPQRGLSQWRSATGRARRWCSHGLRDTTRSQQPRTPTSSTSPWNFPCSISAASSGWGSPILHGGWGWSRDCAPRPGRRIQR